MSHLKKLNEVGSKVGNWIRVKDLPVNKPLLIVECYKRLSKFSPGIRETVVKFENGDLMTLPSRFSTIDEDTVKELNLGNTSVINMGPSGRTHILSFEPAKDN